MCLHTITKRYKTRTKKLWVYHVFDISQKKLSATYRHNRRSPFRYRVGVENHASEVSLIHATTGGTYLPYFHSFVNESDAYTWKNARVQQGDLVVRKVLASGITVKGTQFEFHRLHRLPVVVHKKMFIPRYGAR